MKIAVIIVRILLGLMFLFSSVTYLFHLIPIPEPQGKIKLFMDGVAATGYFMYLLKWTELVCGLAFVIGRFVPLATVVIFPVMLNIVLFNAFLMPQGLPMVLTLLAGNLFLAYAYREKYRPMLAAK